MHKIRLPVQSIMSSNLFLRFASRKCLNLFSSSQTILFRSTQCLDPPDDLFIIPRPPSRENEPVEQRRARLVYQSRKRGMLENDLLLSTFVAKYLKSFDEIQLEKYDRLINGPSNDWEIYYWATNLKETPNEYNDDVMDLLKLHCKNLNKESRIRQPDL